MRNLTFDLVVLKEGQGQQEVSVVDMFTSEPQVLK